MKALDFLKSLDGISFGTDAPKESLYEAIAELEALQQPKSCEGCVKRSTRYCPIRELFIYTYDEFCCNKHERKIDER